MSYLDDSVARLTHFEGSVPWMYQDTHAHVTVGVGQMLPSGAGAQALAFVDSTGNSATAAAILAEYQRVQALAPALNAIAYRVSASPQLPDAAISTLLMARVQEFDSALSAQFANYGTFPDPAKLGLLDMIYNLGPHGLFSGFPTFMGFAQNADWANAALNCHRVGPNTERNAWTVGQFNAAAAMQS